MWQQQHTRGLGDPGNDGPSATARHQENQRLLLHCNMGSGTCMDMYDGKDLVQVVDNIMTMAALQQLWPSTRRWWSHEVQVSGSSSTPEAQVIQAMTDPPQLRGIGKTLSCSGFRDLCCFVRAGASSG